MKNIYKVTAFIDKDAKAELFFDDQNRAERFINAITQILSDKGKNKVTFIPEIISLIDCDEDITRQFDIAMFTNLN